jgi:hypothetical protein
MEELRKRIQSFTPSSSEPLSASLRLLRMCRDGDVLVCDYVPLKFDVVWVGQDRKLGGLHALLTCELELSGAGLDASSFRDLREIEALVGERCLASFKLKAGTSSRLQHDVASSLRGLGLQVEEEAIDDRSGYSIDILVTKGVGRVAVEVDGPTHFLGGGREVNGSTSLKRRHLGLLGYTAVSVPYWEWDALHCREEKEKYLIGLLQLAH